MARTKKAQEDPALPPPDGLVPMGKASEDVLWVHPSCVRAHEDAGWRVVTDGD